MPPSRGFDPTDAGASSVDACPVCDAPAGRLFRKHGIWILGCPSCGHRFAGLQPTADHVTKVYGDAYFTGGGDGYPDYVEEGDLLVAHGRWYAQLLERFATPGRVLDVGAAAGFVLQGLVQGGWTGVGLEPNATMVAHAREHLGLDVRVGTLEGASFDEPFDLVSMIQIVGHFTDLRAALCDAARLTRPGGLWLVESWDRGSAMARAFGRSWHEYSPPSVLHWFTREGFAALASQFGFDLVDSGRPPKYLKARHLKSLVAYKLQETPLDGVARHVLGTIPDGLTVPYPSFDLFWMVLRRRAVDRETPRG